MKKITIDIKRYDKLILDSLKLRCLEASGVSNWSGYDVVMDEITKWKQRLVRRVLKKKRCIANSRKKKPLAIDNTIKEALADGRICVDKRGGCDNWSYDFGGDPFDCGGNPKPNISYAFYLGDDDAGYSETTYCEKCTIKMLKEDK